MNVNVFSFSGRLTKAPQAKQVNDRLVHTFSVAVNSYAGKDKDQDVFYVNCTIWGDRGKYLAKFNKGVEVTITGKLIVSKWTTKDGAEKTVLGCIVNDYDVHAKAPVEQPSVRTVPSTSSEENDNEDDDDVPF